MIESQLLLILLLIISLIGLPAVGVILTLIYCYYNYLFSWQSTQTQLLKEIEQLRTTNNKLTKEQESINARLLESLTINN
jgi:hypothetical protein